MDAMTADPVPAARAGDAMAFRRLVDQHSRTVFQLCWRITRDEALAEDAAQEAFYRAWRGLPEFDGRAAFSTWLHQIAVNAALEQLRRNARHQQRVELPNQDVDEQGDFLDFVEGELPGPDDHAAADGLQRRVAAELERMSVIERTAFVLRHIEGASLEDIGAVLELNIGQSKQAIFRAVRKLRGVLGAWREA
jgi:RNA polymerase sigma-70 factor (ECF subfamily)